LPIRSTCRVPTAALRSRAKSANEHICDERRLDFQMFRLRGQIARFEVDLARFLESSAGRFEA
jgi:hypothetical protein